MFMDSQAGWVEVVTGCMYAGKSAEVRRRVRHELRVGKQVQLFTAGLEEQEELTRVSVGRGPEVVAERIEQAGEILSRMRESTEVVVIDEVQFFQNDLFGVVDELTHHGVRVICAGLDTDFRGRGFPVMGQLMAEAELVHKLQAICAQCGGSATRTQRLVDGRPAERTEPTVQGKQQVEYEPRCRACHMVPHD